MKTNIHYHIKANNTLGYTWPQFERRRAAIDIINRIPDLQLLTSALDESTDKPTISPLIIEFYGDKTCAKTIENYIRNMALHNADTVFEIEIIDNKNPDSFHNSIITYTGNHKEKRK